MDAESMVSRLVGIKPVIEEIMSISGAVGLSYGIIHHGQVLHTANFGFRDYEEKLPVDSKTMFVICSMTKGLVSSALGTLVEEQKLSWDSPVHQLLPSFAPHSSALKENATLLDFLSMRSGIERYNVWSQSENRINFPKSESMKVINSLRPSSELRYKFLYNNWGYEIADHVCKEVGGESWDSMLHSKFFDPLGMTRTDARGQRERFDNVAEAYMVLDNKDPVRVPKTPQSGATLMGAAGGVQSCIDDLLILYRSMLKACISQFKLGNTSTPGNPFQQLTSTMSAHTILPGYSLRESSYGMGWIRTQLPNQMCKISPNYSLLGTAPTVDNGGASRLIIAHYGSMPGSYSGVNLFPETESAIVVLINTTPMCDLSDWMTQLLTQTIFDVPEKVDFVSWVRQTVDAELGWHARIVSDMKRNQKPGTTPSNLGKYVGRYVNAAATFFMEVSEQQEKLILRFEGRQDEAFSMKHYHDDTFSWLQSRNELVSRARTVLQPASYYMIRFERSETGSIDRLYWTHDSELPNGEEYIKDSVTKYDVKDHLQKEL